MKVIGKIAENKKSHQHTNKQRGKVFVGRKFFTTRTKQNNERN